MSGVLEDRGETEDGDVGQDEQDGQVGVIERKRLREDEEGGSVSERVLPAGGPSGGGVLGTAHCRPPLPY